VSQAANDLASAHPKVFLAIVQPLCHGIDHLLQGKAAADAQLRCIADFSVHDVLSGHVFDQLIRCSLKSRGRLQYLERQVYVCQVVCQIPTDGWSDERCFQIVWQVDPLFCAKLTHRLYANRCIQVHM
jgi:hypothetical protein